LIEKKNINKNDLAYSLQFVFYSGYLNVINNPSNIWK